MQSLASVELENIPMLQNIPQTYMQLKIQNKVNAEQCKNSEENVVIHVFLTYTKSNL